MNRCVSIIIPNYNNAAWLPACLDSCLDQAEFVKEIIVVDDHSTDNSKEVLEYYRSRNSELINIYDNPRKGANQARNYGFEKSSGKIIQWLDSDDELLPCKFSSQLPMLLHGKAEIVYSDCRIDYWEKGIVIKSKEKRYYQYDDFLKELLVDNWTSPNNYLLARTIACKLADGFGWNPQTQIGQDREYFTMAGILGAKFAYVPGVYAVYNKQSSGTVSTIDFKKRLELNQVLEKRFRVEIKNSQLISAVKKKHYFKILNTHQIKACFYNRNVRLDRIITPFNIDWKLMHWKMKLVIPLIFLVKNFQLVIDSR